MPMVGTCQRSCFDRSSAMYNRLALALIGLTIALNPAIADAKKKKKSKHKAAVAAEVQPQSNGRTPMPQSPAASLPQADAQAAVTRPVNGAQVPVATPESGGQAAATQGNTEVLAATATADAEHHVAAPQSDTNQATAAQSGVDGQESKTPPGDESVASGAIAEEPREVAETSAIPLDDDAGPAYGEDPIAAGKVKGGAMRMLLQVRYRSTWADESRLLASPIVAEQQKGTLQDNDGFDVQRAFLRYVASPSKRVDAKFLVDFAELKHNNVPQSFKLAYIETHVTKRLEIDFGLLKRTYSLLELLPIAKHELADLGPTDDFIKNQGYAGRDIGAVVRIQPLPTRRMMTVSLSAFRGDIDEGFDASPIKLLGARIETHPIKHLRLGVNGMWRPNNNVKMQQVTADDGTVGYQQTVSMYRGAAVGFDATLAYRLLEVRGEVLAGQRTDVNPYSTARQPDFLAAWLLVAPKIPVGKWVLVPAAKAEILDIDALNTGGRRQVLSLVVGAMPLPGYRVILDVTRTWTDYDVMAMQNVPWVKPKIYVYEPNSTSATLQAQVVF